MLEAFVQKSAEIRNRPRVVRSTVVGSKVTLVCAAAKLARSATATVVLTNIPTDWGIGPGECVGQKTQLMFLAKVMIDVVGWIADYGYWRDGDGSLGEGAGMRCEGSVVLGGWEAASGKYRRETSE
jgi:hypothetical protein